MNSKALFMMIPAVFSLIGAGCNSSGASNAGAATVNSMSNPTQGAAAITGTSMGSSCKSGDPTQVCLGLKYVVYKSTKGQDVVSSENVVKVIEEVNQIWKQCSIAFQVDEYIPAQVESYKLNFSPANNAELEDIRKAFQDNDTLLVTTTGKWDRSGSLGNTGANAWASMPGELLYGVVLESTVGTFSNIIAHELGHYLNLDHEGDTSNLLSAIIGDYSKKLTQSQCAQAHATISKYWQRMVR